MICDWIYYQSTIYLSKKKNIFQKNYNQTKMFLLSMHTYYVFIQGEFLISYTQTNSIFMM